MKNQDCNQQDKIRDVTTKLYNVSSELRALAYLFETQGSKTSEFSEFDMDLIGHGIGRIIKRLARQVRVAARDLDGD